MGINEQLWKKLEDQVGQSSGQIIGFFLTFWLSTIKQFLFKGED